MAQRAVCFSLPSLLGAAYSYLRAAFASLPDKLCKLSYLRLYENSILLRPLGKSEVITQKGSQW
jgi:hypothetical protein